MEAFNFLNISPIFKILAIIQLVLFGILFFITIFFKIYQNFKSKKENKLIKQVTKLLLKFDSLTLKELQFLKQYRHLSFQAFYLLEQNDRFSNNNQITQNIMIAIFLPFLHEDVISSYWPYRNNAALCYQLKNKYFQKLSTIDESDIVILLKDDVPLVSLNAAIATCYIPTKKSIDTLIDIFSQKRRAQYDLLTEVVKNAAFQVIPYIQKRLIHEKNIFIRVFCYRMLRQLPRIEIKINHILSDLNSNNIDLSLAALAYISYAQCDDYKEHLKKGLKSDFWEVRARAAKLIGYTKDEQLIDVLLPFLKDPVWWVRYRAAEALSGFGPQGIEILKSQKIEIDKFAFEIAQQQLQNFNTQKNSL